MNVIMKPRRPERKSQRSSPSLFFVGPDNPLQPQEMLKNSTSASNAMEVSLGKFLLVYFRPQIQPHRTMISPMKKMNLLWATALLLLAFSSCESPSQETEQATAEETEAVEEGIDKMKWMAATDSLRIFIETAAANLQPIELSTQGTRAKIAQKWSKIHYYAQEGEVVRIKTYPHEGISERTEEFYFSNGQLILAVIEDRGLEAEESIDKMYYFHEGQPIGDKHMNEEAEYGIRQGEAEELLQEAREYLDLFATMP